MNTHQTGVTTAMRALPFPVPLSDLTAQVMARIAQIDETNGQGASGPERPSDWQAWAALGGMAAGVAIATPGYLTSVTFASFTRGGMTGLAAVPDTLPAALSLAAAFGLCLASLFLPLRRDRRKVT